MGTWGVGIFSDDAASDVGEEWGDQLAEGLDAEQATNKLLEEWGASLADPDEGPVLWLALAAAQVRTGRLTDRVRREALSVIDNGIDLRRWEGSPDQRRREAVLKKLRGQILGPQRAPVKVAKRQLLRPRFEVGAAFGFRLENGILALFRCYGMHTDKGGTASCVELLDWIGSEVPAELDIERLPRRLRRFPSIQTSRPAVYMPVETPRAHRFPAERISVLARGLNVVDPREGELVMLWSRMNDEVWLQLDPDWKPDPAEQAAYEARLERGRGKLKNSG